MTLIFLSVANRNLWLDTIYPDGGFFSAAKFK